MKKILESIKGSFTDKRARYGAFSGIMAILLVAVLVALNLFVSVGNFSFDMTPQKTYTISQTTKDVLAKLTGDVNIYVFQPSNSKDRTSDTINELLKQYAANSGHIKLTYSDPNLHPKQAEQLVGQGVTVPTGSIVVKGDKRYKLITNTDLVTVQPNYQTMSQDIVSVDVEPQVTNALIYVNESSTQKVCVVTGHNEVPLSDNMKKSITTANYDVEDLNLLTADSVPKDAALVLVSTPQRDWTTAETDKLKTYLQGGGRAAFFVDLINVDLTNLDALLATYGVKFSRTYIVEGDNTAYLTVSNTQDGRMNILPSFAPHAITDPLSAQNYKPLMPQTQAVVKSDLSKSGLTIEPLLTTSASSYSKDPTNATSLEKEANDASGPFNLAVAVTDSGNGASTPTKFVAFGSSALLDDTVDSAVSGADSALVVACVNWLADNNNSVSIPPKYTSETGQMQMNGLQALAVAFLTVLVLPVVIFVIGLVVWLRRRHS